MCSIDYLYVSFITLCLSVGQACFSPLSDASSFVVLYIVTSVYFSGVMVRKMFQLTNLVFSYKVKQGEKILFSCSYHLINQCFGLMSQVRLMLVFAPAACIMSGIALSGAFDVFTRSIKFQLPGISKNSTLDVSLSLSLHCRINTFIGLEKCSPSSFLISVKK